MTTKARQLLGRLTRRTVFYVQFTKADHTERSMRCQYEGGRVWSSRGVTMMQVHDLDLLQVRTITLDTIHVLTEQVPSERQAQSFEEIHALCNDSF